MFMFGTRTLYLESNCIYFKTRKSFIQVLYNFRNIYNILSMTGDLKNIFNLVAYFNEYLNKRFIFLYTFSWQEISVLSAAFQ